MIRANVEATRMRFTREDYHRMGETGIIPSDARVELLDGEVVYMSPIGPFHSSVVAQLHRFFVESLGTRAICRAQCPIVLDDCSEPEPDIALVKPRSDFYRSGHPTPADVLLLIEVADASHYTDLGRKLRLYAAAGISDYWVFDLSRSRLIVHREPVGGTYLVVQEFKRASTACSLAFPDLKLDVAQFL